MLHHDGQVEHRVARPGVFPVDQRQRVCLQNVLANEVVVTQRRCEFGQIARSREKA